MGIDNGAVCTSKRALKKRVAQMLEQFEEVLVQEYVPGREFNVGFVGKRMLPIAEIRFDGMPEGTWPIVSYAAKWIPGSPEDEGTMPVCPAEVPDELERQHRQGGPATPGSTSPAARATAGWTSGSTRRAGRTCSRSIPAPTSPATPGSPAWAAPSAGATTTS